MDRASLLKIAWMELHSLITPNENKDPQMQLLIFKQKFNPRNLICVLYTLY